MTISKKIDGQYGFVQTVADKIKLFTKQQVEGALKARHLYETLGYPSTTNSETVLRQGSIGGCTLIADNARLPTKFGGIHSLGLRIVLSERLVNASRSAW